MLNVEGLSSFYGRIQALRRVDFTIAKGEIVTLVGANGAGKTTLLRTISGVQPVTDGKITFEGEDITRATPFVRVARGISQSPEGRQIFAPLSVEDNLRLGAYLRKDKNIEKDKQHVFDMFPVLQEFRERMAGSLSGGQQQMLAISRALMANPDLILLDEPSLGLSPKLTKEIFEIVVRINRERGTTILLVEQNANMALNASDYGYVLENGRIVMEDTCERLREKDDIKEFYLGMKEEGARGERRWKKKKNWR